MKTTTYIKTLLIALVCLGSKSMAQTYPVYIAGSNTVITLKPTNVTINAGDQVVWVETTGGSNNQVQSGTTQNYTTPANLSIGEHSYRVHIISAAPASCTGDPSVEYKVFKLPATTVALSAPTNALYCENASTPSSQIVATPSTTLPSGVTATYAYTWTATKGGTSTAVNSVGSSSNAANTLSSTFTVSTVSVGTYKLQAQATPSFTVPVGSVLKGAGEAATSGEETVKVEPKPGQPTIEVD